ncbi:amidohydrolase family protein [Paenibacillus sp. IB182496]|uniref:Amidohydrolase family protein n=1 Tax=Paenibacillus sabuli TaxID=2772509 RepID=A0A927GQI8_9BACL|nr:amidohydrolase family protein [Paenibacillus sabuli]MBD2843812.1 amidohydrolase family protein [Paenibacillus sabuli]
MYKAFFAKKVFTGREVIPKGVVLIENDRIAGVGTAEEVAVPDGAEIVDCQDRVITPGLIDSHTHLTLSAQIPNYAKAMQDSNNVLLLRGANNMQTDLASGVTTMRILGEKAFIDVSLKEATEKGIFPGPRLLISGKGIRSSFGHGIMASPYDGVDEVTKAVRINIHDAGADQIKLFITGSQGEFKNFTFSAGRIVERNGMHSLFTRAEIQAAVDTAHSVGKKVAAHCYGGTGLRQGVEAGIDTIEHGIYMDDEELELMIKHGTWLTLTSYAYLNDQRFINRGTPELTKGFFQHRDYIREAYRKAVHSSLQYGVGTDGQHGEIAFELETLVELGVKPVIALRAATSQAAKLCGVDDKVGALQPGMLADLAVVNGDPTERISDIRRIQAVYKGGQVAYEAAADRHAVELV